MSDDSERVKELEQTAVCMHDSNVRLMQERDAAHAELAETKKERNRLLRQRDETRAELAAVKADRNKWQASFDQLAEKHQRQTDTNTAMRAELSRHESVLTIDVAAKWHSKGKREAFTEAKERADRLEETYASYVRYLDARITGLGR